MGEVVVVGEGGMELEVEETEVVTEAGKQAEEKNEKQKIAAEGGNGGGETAAGSATSVVRWERFLPKMVVRVLLVEADDSTRQIIAALLRKCSYRAVAAVPDGLKAWEVLKGRPRTIDLILTEVELPSISGYALLTLIMEHEVCKNIPVIMMSSQDSVSTVYKCMLRGATDFLVKPVRKNELRNLWQHVWRKQASSTGAGLGPPDLSIAQQKDEDTSENNPLSNHSSGYISTVQKNRECIEKGSDIQSSCSKPELEIEGEDSEQVDCFSQPKSTKCLSDDLNVPTQEGCHQESRRQLAHDDETEESQAVPKVDANYAITREEKNSDDSWEEVNTTVQVSEKNNVLDNSSKEAIDLIGAFDNHLKGTFGSAPSNFSANKFDNLPQLDLSLKRYHPVVMYINKPLPLRNCTSPGTCNQLKDHDANSEKQQSREYNSDTHGPTVSSQKHVSVATIQTGQPEMTFSYSQNRKSHPIPVRGMRFENILKDYGSVMPPTYHAQSGQSPLPSPDRYKRGHKLENLEDPGHVSPANDQSGTSSFCNSNVSHHQSTGSGSNGKINVISGNKTPSECVNEESFHAHEGSLIGSTQREAALTKFRMKRKDRCFEKKVRYESRKKLAEQRPRVKGQFVRQVPNDPQPGNSLAGARVIGAPQRAVNVFSLKEADINQLNLSGPSLLNSSIQLTLLSNNPNKKVGIYYDEFLLYASYKGQKITPETSISPFYQEHEETNLLSASLVGNQQPVAPSFAYEVQRDQGTGKLVLSFKVMGRLRWKVGTWVSGSFACFTCMVVEKDVDFWSLFGGSSPRDGSGGKHSILAV
ncbi:Two-component response regulator-like APRR5 [Sesamum angolense]|uniref:Two-component response regulator-like APRR5 n=1 Tax=Sesamum angolense TaxID=2727404 RepID=A0AAE1TA96_9LAMI|nr:Two-component response regulator-like APRR5 [Sesamum angolense]